MSRCLDFCHFSSGESGKRVLQAKGKRFALAGFLEICWLAALETAPLAHARLAAHSWLLAALAGSLLNVAGYC